MQKLKDYRLFTCTERNDDLPFVIVVPQCNKNTWFDHFETLKEFAFEIAGADFTDAARYYLMGVSMGGYGTWELAMIRPEWFAAIMPICGGGIPAFTKKLINVPVRTFHGLLDDVVDPIESLEMVKALNRFGGHAELILFPDLKHSCWIRVYDTEENYDWLLSHTLYHEEADAAASGDYAGENYG